MLSPALLTRMSSRRKRSRMNSAIRSAVADCARSPSCTCAAPPLAWMRSATLASGARRRPLSTTVAPSRASISAAASPMPLPAPVTHAVFPCKAAIASLLCCALSRLEADRQRLQSTQHEAVAPLDRARSQRETGQPLDQRPDRDLALEARQRRAEAEVDAVAE